MTSIDYAITLINGATAQLTELVLSLKGRHTGLDGNVVPNYDAKNVVVNLRDQALSHRAGSVYPVMWNGNFAYINAVLRLQWQVEFLYSFGFGRFAPTFENESQTIGTDSNAFLLAHLFAERTNLKASHHFKGDIYFGTVVSGSDSHYWVPPELIEDIVQTYLDLMNTYYPEKPALK